MADAPTSFSIETGTAAVLQASTQYTAGLLTGALIDWVFLHWRTAPDNLLQRTAKLVVQAGVNGYALSMLLPWLHPRNLSNYTDPTGGYLLAFGMMHSQPNLGRNAKEIVDSFLEIYSENFMMTTPELESDPAN